MQLVSHQSSYNALFEESFAAQSPESVPVQVNSLSAASASTQLAFREALCWAVQIRLRAAQALSQLPSYALRYQMYPSSLPQTAATVTGGSAGGGGGTGGEGVCWVKQIWNPVLLIVSSEDQLSSVVDTPSGPM